MINPGERSNSQTSLTSLSWIDASGILKGRQQRAKNRLKDGHMKSKEAKETAASSLTLSKMGEGVQRNSPFSTERKTLQPSASSNTLGGTPQSGSSTNLLALQAAESASDNGARSVDSQQLGTPGSNGSSGSKGFTGASPLRTGVRLFDSKQRKARSKSFDELSSLATSVKVNIDASAPNTTSDK